MALRSITFKDDRALQECLLLDSAHVVPGATGLHVARIQSALLLLDHAAISTAELRSKSYGPTTTAAVLAFKRKRNIINTSYQTQADDIVGKMTIARLDDEILAVEGRITSRVVCGTNGAVGARSLSIAPPASAVTAGKTAPTKQNRLLRAVFQATSTAEGTLIHEMIHASIRGESLPHDEDNPRNVYSTALSGRDQLTEKRAAQLAAAYFK